MGEDDTDAAGTPLATVHAVKSNAASGDTGVHRDKDREMLIPIIILMNGPATDPFFTGRPGASTPPRAAGAARARAHAR